jgi:spore cortex formation protein SpoVR/YcgB (stage V sporulation)
MSTTLIRAERPLFEGADWEFGTIQRCHDEIEKVALQDMGLNVYTNQIEVIGTEQMLDAYSSIGMPLFYKHWSFGKHFSRHEAMYRGGMQGLAYEIVINSNPCISYIMEENTATMQTLVIAHAAFGHNHFFKNNYLFQQWTDANGILDYLEFAKDYIMSCEQRYGEAAVERLLDAAHALMSHAVHKYPRKRATDLRTEEKREQERREHDEKIFNDLWRTVPGKENVRHDPTAAEQRKALLELPQENILYFMEKSAPRLASWQREILRIVRMIAQYFYPQSQTKVMNEGCATYTHYTIMNRLHEKGLLTDGAMVEFLSSHTNVVFQPEYDDRRYSGLNPYALGFAMMQDIERICTVPTAEDKQWFPHIAGCNDHMNVLRDVWANYRDESFILQYLSPRLVRHFSLFHVVDDASEPNMRVEAIHDERGYRKIKQALAKQYDVSWNSADIQVVDVNLAGDRRLILHHRALNRVLLEEKDARMVLQHLADLWGYDVLMKEIDPGTDAVMKEHAASPRPGIVTIEPK